MLAVFQVAEAIAVYNAEATPARRQLMLNRATAAEQLAEEVKDLADGLEGGADGQDDNSAEELFDDIGGLADDVKGLMKYCRRSLD